MTELDELMRWSRGLWWTVVVSPMLGAAIALCANGYRQWVVEPRIAAIKAETQQKLTDGLRAEVTRADQRAAEAEGLAARAGAAADAARQRADRHLPVASSATIVEKVERALASWASHRKLPLNLTWVGQGSPAMDQVAGQLFELFKKAHLTLGNTTSIGMAGGLPQGALLFCGESGKAEGAALVEALRPLIRNLELRVGSAPDLTLHINGRPAFEADGSFTIE